RLTGGDGPVVRGLTGGAVHGGGGLLARLRRRGILRPVLRAAAAPCHEGEPEGQGQERAQRMRRRFHATGTGRGAGEIAPGRDRHIPTRYLLRSSDGSGFWSPGPV